ncbi:hypothetical protein DFQ28_009017 [Apophysomyces sp. BC1034]|nr:hypothetical protein DFQ30_003445 [Apophysomyces sp. BC1015]KAG0180345.1 hypothetical protein DFQ29_000871 [Apophysomyces sp. BC1021]KAG0185663.1 hypothetical protein DFQ28_009017 [Apophysomyces sp. BC1034]
MTTGKQPQAEPYKNNNNSGKSDDSHTITRMHPSMKRPRAPIACFRCHHKKVRCDGIHPNCTRCLSTGVLCAYPSSRRSRNTQPTNVDPFIDNISQLEGRIRRIESDLESQRALMQSMYSSNASSSSSQASELTSQMVKTEQEVQESRSILAQLRLRGEQRIARGKRSGTQKPNHKSAGAVLDKHTTKLSKAHPARHKNDDKPHRKTAGLANGSSTAPILTTATVAASTTSSFCFDPQVATFDTSYLLPYSPMLTPGRTAWPEIMNGHGGAATVSGGAGAAGGGSVPGHIGSHVATHAGQLSAFSDWYLPHTPTPENLDSVFTSTGTALDAARLDVHHYGIAPPLLSTDSFMHIMQDSDVVTNCSVRDMSLAESHL